VDIFLVFFEQQKLTICAEMRILVNRMKFYKTNIHAKSAVELENSFYAILNISSLKIYPSTFYTLSVKLFRAHLQQLWWTGHPWQNI
jgi:hypothetical protein